MLKKAIVTAALASTTLVTLSQTPTTPQPSRQWQKAAGLLPGSEILVRERGQRSSQACILVWIDNAALACDALTTTGTHRVVYPASSVASVTEAPSFSDDQDRPSLALPLIFAGSGALLGGLAARDAGTSAGFVGALLGAGLGGGLGAGVQSITPPPRTPWSLRIPIGAPRVPLHWPHFRR